MKNRNIKKLCICLSHQIHKDLTLSFDALKRIKKTSEVYNEIKASFFVTTGWKYDSHLNEPMCKIMSKYAINILNIDRKNIIEISEAKDTVGEALFLKVAIKKLNLKINEMHIITSDWHLERSKEIFDFIFGGKDDPKLFYYEIKGDSKERKKEEINQSILKFRRLKDTCIPGDIKNIYKEVIKTHPMYNLSPN